jgi:RNA polymerase sigma factor (sigma-70 family)
MDHEKTVLAASRGSVGAFVDLTRRYQNFAFGTALALVSDFQTAEDVVQEAMVEAWSSLPSLTEPKAFPGWLRSIVRRQVFRVMRRGRLSTTPLDEAAGVPADDPSPELRAGQRRAAAVALNAISALSPTLREPALLYFVHECSQQDIATFLGLPVATVNNRLHAARSQLKQRMLAMAAETIRGQALPDDFANRIGKVIATRGRVVDALFDPDAVPKILAELAVSDQAQRGEVRAQVVQRPGGGRVRAIALSPISDPAPGSTVLSSGLQSTEPIGLADLGAILSVLCGEWRQDRASRELVETGIKAIDLMCPFAAGASVVIAGEAGAGASLLTEELARRLCGIDRPISLVTLIPLRRDAAPDWSFDAQLRKEGFGEGNVGDLQTFFFAAEDEAWTDDRLNLLGAADVVVRLSSAHMASRVYPPIDVLTSRSRLLANGGVTAEHAETARWTREALAELWAKGGATGGEQRLTRALKLQNFLTQPFDAAQRHTGLAGVPVSLAATIRGCRDILRGRYDEFPIEAFFFGNDMRDIEGNRDRALAFGPVCVGGSHALEKRL